MGIFCNFSCFSFDSPQLDVAESWEEVVIVVESGDCGGQSNSGVFQRIFCVWGGEGLQLSKENGNRGR